MIYLHLPLLKSWASCFSSFPTQDIADSKIISLALVTLPTEKENWIVAGTQSGSLWAVNTEDETRRHRLQKMSDSITCLYCNSLSKQRYKWIFNVLGCNWKYSQLRGSENDISTLCTFVLTTAYFACVST